MNWKRVFRVLICLVMVCALVVNISPVRSKALAVTTGLTAAELAGLLALALGTTAGIVYMVNTRAELGAVGNSIIQVGDEPGDEDALNHLVELTENINGMWEAGDGSGFDPRLGTKLARGLLAMLAGSVVTGIAAGFTGEAEEEVEVEIPEGYASYNGHVLPVINFSCYESEPYCIIHTGSAGYILLVCDAPLSVDLWSGKITVRYDQAMHLHREGFNTDSWSNNACQNISYFAADISSVGDLVWANYDLCDKDDGTLIMSATVPVGSDGQTITIEPVIYIGDLPVKIETGEITEEEAIEEILEPLPEYIDITKIVTSPETAVEELTQWQQAVVDNQKSLEEALEDIAGELEDIQDEVDTNTNTGTITSLLSDILTAIKAIPQALGDLFTNVLSSAFVPSEGFVEDKVTSLRSRFAFADSIISTGEFIRDSISGDSGPPVIYVDLGLAEHDIYGGQKVLLMDFAWYEKYKPTVDTWLSAALWAFFAWRVFLKLPGIISGESGYVGELMYPRESAIDVKSLTAGSSSKPEPKFGANGDHNFFAWKERRFHEGKGKK